MVLLNYYDEYTTTHGTLLMGRFELFHHFVESRLQVMTRSISISPNVQHVSREIHIPAYSRLTLNINIVDKDSSSLW